MALYIPSRRPVVKPNVSTSDHDRERTPLDSPKGWNRLRIREALKRLERGDLGRFDARQLAEIRSIIEQAAGVDGDLSSAQTREAIRMIETNRVRLDLDQKTVVELALFLALGPTD